MTVIRQGALALLLCCIAGAPATAAVTYALTGSFLFGSDPAGLPVFATQQLTFTVAAPLAATRSFAVAELSTCDPGAPFVCDGAAFVLAGDLANGGSPTESTLAIGGRLPTTAAPDLDLVIPYLFAPDDFAANGVYGTAADSFGRGTLTVSGVPGPVPPGVPEATTWAMMVAGLGAVGALLRGRPRRSGSVAAGPVRAD